jgi:CRISPR/Cas system endoribonuclease Cas6 (RAMP superfamily)
MTILRMTFNFLYMRQLFERTGKTGGTANFLCYSPNQDIVMRVCAVVLEAMEFDLQRDQVYFFVQSVETVSRATRTLLQ